MKHTKNVFTKPGNKPSHKRLKLYNTMLGAQSATDAPITIKRVLDSFVFCSTLFLQYPVSKTGFLLQKRFRIER